SRMLHQARDRRLLQAHAQQRRLHGCRRDARHAAEHRRRTARRVRSVAGERLRDRDRAPHRVRARVSAPEAEGALMTETPRKLSRSETHDLSMIIKDRTKVLLRAADAQAAACAADFEKKLDEMFSWDTDETWRRAAENAQGAVDEV